MQSRLLEIRYTFALLRYAIWASVLTYLSLFLFVCVTSAFYNGHVHREAVESVTEFGVFVTPALLGIQSAVYFGNTFGRARIEWQPISIHRQLAEALVVTLLTYLAAAIVFRLFTFAAITPLPVGDREFMYTLWHNTSTTDFVLRGLLALLLSLELFFALVFFGASFRYPIIALTYQAVTLFALFQAHQFLSPYSYSQIADVNPILVIIALALLVALPMLFATPVLLTAIARTSNGLRSTVIVTAPMMAAIVCFSVAMQWLHHRSLSIFRSTLNTQDISAPGSPLMYSLAARLDDSTLIDIPLQDTFNHSGSGSEAERGIELHNNRGDIVTLLPDGSRSLVSVATDRPTASPLSGEYPQSGKSIPGNAVTTSDGNWIIGTESDDQLGTTRLFLRFANAHGSQDAALPEDASFIEARGFNWGIRAYKQGALIAIQRHKPDDRDAPEGPPTFLYYSTQQLGGARVEPADLGQLSPLDGLRLKLDDEKAPRQLLWTDSHGRHECPLPGKLRYVHDLKPFASVLHGEPFIWISNTGFTTQVPLTFCYRGGVFTADISADKVQFVGDELVVFGTERLWRIRGFDRSPDVVPYPSVKRDGIPSYSNNQPLHMDDGSLWYSDAECALKTVDLATGATRVLFRPSYASHYIARRDGVFVRTGFEWSYVSWQGTARQFGVLFPPSGH